MMTLVRLENSRDNRDKDKDFPNMKNIKIIIKDLFEVFDLWDCYDSDHPDIDATVKSAYLLLSETTIGEKVKNLILGKCGENRVDSNLSNEDYLYIFNDNAVKSLFNSNEYKSLVDKIKRKSELSS